VWLEELCKLENSNNLIGNPACNLPACSLVPQPTVLLHALDNLLEVHNTVFTSLSIQKRFTWYQQQQIMQMKQ
jgi:hypothetical protein